MNVSYFITCHNDLKHSNVYHFIINLVYNFTVSFPHFFHFIFRLSQNSLGKSMIERNKLRHNENIFIRMVFDEIKRKIIEWVCIQLIHWWYIELVFMYNIYVFNIKSCLSGISCHMSLKWSYNHIIWYVFCCIKKCARNSSWKCGYVEFKYI